MTPELLAEVRARFTHIDSCPFEGARVFFENAGGALTLKSVVETSAFYAGLPDNQGRANDASSKLSEVITKAKQDACLLFNASGGQVFVGESGTELLFRILSVAILAAAPQGNVLGSSFEHPASRSAAQRWAAIAGKDYVSVPHDNETGLVTDIDYRAYVTTDTRVATILQCSPVTGMVVDVAAIVREIRKISPDCFIVVDGIQHAAHGGIDVDAYGIDAYVISPYKVFSRHGYGIAWVSDRIARLPHNSLVGGPADNWEMGTRDTGAYATFSNVVDYFDWLGSTVVPFGDRRARIDAASDVIHAQESALTQAMLFGVGNHKGLSDYEQVQIIGGADNPERKGLVSFSIKSLPSADVVERLRLRGIRTHERKADHYSGNILNPLGLLDCVRVSLCHYNSLEEVAKFLCVMQEIITD
ncbi:cysteine desulfurase-like protein [Amylibacter marinus]|uniref:Cysteine desulfurase-like protein n=1 Tax=Amylibacter marinus TaxID=1475483 RepID=A0ABQ5VTK1_9RHOB|nr:aminotransferase class V-fold PLP-dependent enzyme [Amylibacter marinus]GLQ34696.1 cysteine desulfurase-like protein [Amylibacter marinus]